MTYTDAIQSGSEGSIRLIEGTMCLLEWGSQGGTVARVGPLPIVCRDLVELSIEEFQTGAD